MREIRNLYRFIPFGKYSLSGRGKPPFNQVFVGRQKERANFIELLVHQERFGAFLISGQRGAGKTSFVDYCLNEYKRMAFQRSIRLSRNSLFHGILLLGMLFVAAIAFYVLLSQLLELSAQNVFEAIIAGSNFELQYEGDVSPEVFASSVVVWMILPLITGSLIMAMPIYFALKAPMALAGLADTPIGRSFRLTMFSIMAFVIPGVWLLLSFFGLGLNINMVIAFFLWTLGPLAAYGSIIQATFRDPRNTAKAARGFTMFAVVLSLITGVMSLLNLSGDETGIDRSDLLFFLLFNLLFAKGLVSIWGKTRPRKRVSVLSLLASIAVASYTIFYTGEFFSEVVGATGALSLNCEGGSLGFCVRAPEDAKLVGVFYVPALMFFLGLWLFHLNLHVADPKEEDNELTPGPIATILILKSNLLIVLGLVGLLPLLRVILGWIFIAFPGSHTSFLEGLPSLNLSHASYITIFLLLGALAYIYWCEFTWICRDLRSYRQDSGLGLLGRAREHPTVLSAWGISKRRSNDTSRDRKQRFFSIENLKKWYAAAVTADVETRDPDNPSKNRSRQVRALFSNHRNSIETKPMQAPPFYAGESMNAGENYARSHLVARRRYVFRTIESATIPWLIYSIANPVLLIWINLGFDNLDHSRIIEAMLRKLRQVYKRTFLGLSCAIGLLSFTFFLAITVLMTSLLSKSLFQIPNISEIERQPGFVYRFEGTNVSTLPVFGATNYCGFFEVYPETAPNIKSLICALPFSNEIMELVYSPILQIHTDFSSNVPRQALPRHSQVTGKEKKLTKPCYSSPRYDLHELRPLFHAEWADCLPKLGNAESDTDDVLDRFFIGTVAEPHVSFSSYRNLFNSLVGSTSEEEPVEPQTRNADAAWTPVAGSELLRFLLDGNYGLPRIDFDQAEEKWHAAYSPFASGQAGPPTLRVYHLLLYTIGFWLIFTVNRKIPLLPYRANLDAMNELIMLINGRETLRSGGEKNNSWLGALNPFRKPERTIETANDPRIVEQELIELLVRLRPHQSPFRGNMRSLFEVRPEITFVFDEMDKLSGIVDAELSKDAEGPTQVEENYRERARSLQLHQLLSDMKRLISGNTARFIFIGGRLYHDEWLADQAQRAPLLNSIFNGQIYLPSLMADRRHPYGRFNDRVTELVTLLYRNSRHRLLEWSKLRRQGPFRSTSGSLEPTYAQFELPYSGHPRRLAIMAHETGMRVADSNGMNYSVSTGRWRKNVIDKYLESHETLKMPMTLGEEETLEQFINFLTYRSAGNPKKLKELLQGLMQTSSYALALPRHDYRNQQKARWTQFVDDGHDVIFLDDNSIYRMQFIDVLYRHLADHMETRMLDRDDKVSMSIFYLMDFLLKFHNRGFSRTNLQRVDELSHIHRAPDLRSVMGTLVRVTSERFLHRVLNGVYSFRFRSDFAREIDYLSRISKEEMAALNFTLDESQSLKGLYQQTINTGERENIDTVSGLGELYEYDQEYEIARNYYRRAIAMLDETQMISLKGDARHLDQDSRSNETNDQVGRGFIEFSMIGEIFTTGDTKRRRKLLSAQLPWIVARLRLMLQIGQTYEQEMNFERAVATYTHTALVSDFVLDTFGLRSLENSEQEHEETFSDPFNVSETSDLVSTTNLSILFQAGMAAAWVREKDPENIDDGIIYAENWLQRIYEKAPVLQTPLPKSHEYSKLQGFGGSIFIQVSLSHDRIGDLYFMKGRQSLRSTNFKTIKNYALNMAEESPDTGTSFRQGYLDKSHNHYAMAVWMLRKYLSHRFAISKKMMKPINASDPFDVEGIAPSHFHSTLADALTDLSEVIFAKRSSIGTALWLFRANSSCYPGKLKIEALRTYWQYRKQIYADSIERFDSCFARYDGGSDLSESWGQWFKDPHAQLLCPVDSSEAKALKDQLKGKHSIFFQHVSSVGHSPTPLSAWIGQRNHKAMHAKDDPIKPNKHFEHDPILFTQSETTKTGPQATLTAYKFFSQAAARASQRIGQSTNAANEYLLQAEAFISVIWEVKSLRYLKTYQAKKEHSTSFINEIFVDKASTGPLSGKPSDIELFRLGLSSYGSIIDAIERIRFAERPSASRMALNHGDPTDEIGLSNNSHTERRNDYVLAQAYSDDPRPITLTCSLILGLLSEDSEPLCVGLALLAYKDILMDLADDSFDPDRLDGSESNNDKILKRAITTGEVEEETLEELRVALFENTFSGLLVTLERFRYPVLNRLNGLKVLADALLLKRKDGGLIRPEFWHEHGTFEQSQIGRIVRDMISTAEVYSSEMHFPPQAVGSTLAYAFMYMQENELKVLYDDLIGDPPLDHKSRHYFYELRQGPQKDDSQRPQLGNAIFTRESAGEMAINNLNRSQENCAMGDAYYENIAYLHYLNDDFNDRSIHFNHAKSMAVSDLSEILALIVKEGLSSKNH